jgi:hypothetical protein
MGAEEDTATAAKCTQHRRVLYGFPVENCREGDERWWRGGAVVQVEEDDGLSYSTTASDAQTVRQMSSRGHQRAASRAWRIALELTGPRTEKEMASVRCESIAVSRPDE